MVVVLLSILIYSQSLPAFEQKKKARTTEADICQRSIRLSAAYSHSRFRDGEYPYKIENISSSPPPGRTNAADQPFKPNNVCNAIPYRSQAVDLPSK